MTNRERFIATLTGRYAVLFVTDADYGFAAMNITPERLAVKMTDGLMRGNANKDGKGIRQTCKVLGIPYTYLGIETYLREDVE